MAAEKKYQPGVAITFDDRYIGEWLEASEALAGFGFKATFFVSSFHLLSKEEIEKVKRLRELGHEIGGHGHEHLDSKDFCEKNGIGEYLIKEISPMTNAMAAEGIYPTSFAYPFGSRSAETDEAMLRNFQIVRGTVYGEHDPARHRCYFDGSRLAMALGIDRSYSHSSMEYLISILEHAKQSGKIAIFYSHRPTADAGAEYETDLATLAGICDYVKSNGMKFYKMSELYNLCSCI